MSVSASECERLFAAVFTSRLVGFHELFASRDPLGPAIGVIVKQL